MRAWCVDPRRRSPPATDLFLADLSVRGRTVVICKPSRATERTGYDNQPAFSPDGRVLYFTAIAGGNADIQRYDLTSGETRPVAVTPESEYSPPRPRPAAVSPSCAQSPMERAYGGYARAEPRSASFPT